MSGRIITHHDVEGDVSLTCDVCIVGSGAGGAVLAAELSQRGLDVVVLEEGGWYTRGDFDGDESVAYPRLYQERGLRATADLGISILQGRSVGGGTTVNWTTCYRTPDRILDLWASRFGVEGLSPSDLAPHFDAVEERLNITPWEERQANANNQVLFRGCRALGWQVDTLRRNVKGCGATGMCGVGCPLDAKQSMHLTYLPDAMERGATVYAGARVEGLTTANRRVSEVRARIIDPATDRPTGASLTVRPRVAVSACGAINSPALLLRSQINPNGLVGKRTLLHPVVALPALYEERINGFYGAPQAACSHHFVDRGPDHVGYFVETPPLQPMLAATGSTVFGRTQQDFMRQLPYVGVLLAICVDGLAPGCEGGEVSIRNDGRVRIDYTIGPRLLEAFRHAHRSMAQIELAAGARGAQSTHLDPIEIVTEADLAKLDDAPYGPLQHSIFSAHQMGGCQMGGRPDASVVDNTFRVREVDNLFVVDGSVFPTALGVNPSETIYALARMASQHVAAAL